ncbi:MULTISPECIES: ECF-type sigma factor [Stenotrophomonas]|uniref:RNA polymerase subunit sigma-70 n=1 Tax=Stenotrophomonas maltophilia TaxID=40324 RepID=A0A3S0HYX2_STEMA|nr:ECF-type sigma factor [Stenotrophomonas maltophilia]RTQ90988.1 RNA polymerase subunit sigma-70 [Stenotrophomonas maltophilia]
MNDTLPPVEGITHLLARWQDGEAPASDTLARLVYDELHQIAVRSLARGVADGFQPTELVNEAWMRLSAREHGFASRGHFYAVASLQMRHLLVDLARMRDRGKRRGQQVTLTVKLVDPGVQPVDLLSIAEAFDELARLDARKARAFAMTELVGLTVAETANLLDISIPTAERDLRFVRVWLAARLSSC